MFKLTNFLKEKNIKNDLKSYKLALVYSFSVCFIIGSIPFVYKLKENFRIQKQIQEQRKIEIQNKEKMCKENNSDYKKFVNLGFPKTAIEKLNICMEEQ